MIRLVLADDNARVRQGLRMALALEPDLVVVGEAASGRGVLELAAATNPDVIVMDMVMPGTDGADATSALRATAARCRVVVLSMHGDSASRRRALAAGATAFVEKGEGLNRLVAAIRSAASHQGGPPVI